VQSGMARQNESTNKQLTLHALWLSLIVAGILAVYKDLPKSMFFLDDYLHLHLIQQLDSVLEPFVVDIFMGAFFRPAITLFWKLDYLISGLNPTGYYLANLVYLILSMIFLYFIILNMMGSRALSVIISLLFAIGPVTGVGVMWLSNRFDLIGTMFILASTRLFLRYVRYRRMGDYLLSIALAALAFFCKEITITLPVVLVLSAGFMFMYRAPSKLDVKFIKRILALTTPYFTIAAIYMIWRFLIIKSMGGYVGETKAPFSLGYIFFLWHSFAEYFWLMKSFIVFGSILIIIGLFLAKKDFYANNKLFFYGLLFALITMAPLALVLRYQNVMAYMTPRFFFLPNIGLLIALASIYDPRSAKARRVLALVVLVLVGLFFALNNYILVHKWARDKQKLVARPEQVHEYLQAQGDKIPSEGMIYSCLHGMDVALDTSIKLMHPEYMDRYYFLNCTGPTQTIARRPLYYLMRRNLNFPQTFSRNPCDYQDLVYGVVQSNPANISSQASAATNVMVLHLDWKGRMALLGRDTVVGILQTLGIVQ